MASRASLTVRSTSCSTSLRFAHESTTQSLFLNKLNLRFYSLLLLSSCRHAAPPQLTSKESKGCFVDRNKFRFCNRILVTFPFLFLSLYSRWILLVRSLPHFHFPILHKKWTDLAYNFHSDSPHWYFGSAVKQDMLQERENGNTSHIFNPSWVCTCRKPNNWKQQTRVLKGG